MSAGEGAHVPVLRDETATLIIGDKAGTYLDGTLGLGGHAKEFLARLAPEGRLVGLDLDAGALEIARGNLREFGERAILIKSNFANAPAALESAGINQVSGALFDLGLSSYQLDNPERGFSFNSGGPLDMRFDSDAGLTALEIVNTWPYEQLERIIREYGEERFSGKVAAAIIEARRKSRLETGRQLKAAVESAVFRRAGSRISPATRTFQALRIAVNGEFENIAAALDNLERMIKPGGRAGFITFHSLEDRMVKRRFKALEAGGGWRPATKKPVCAGEAEIAANPRARSAKLRVIERPATI